MTIKRAKYGQLNGFSVRWGKKSTALLFHDGKISGSINFSGMTLNDLKRFGEQLTAAASPQAPGHRE